MGIFCQMNLYRPPDGVYHSGQTISGLIKYVLNEPLEVIKIITSLKGIGQIILTDNQGTLSSTTRTYTTKEQYVDIDTIIQDEKLTIPAGSYEIKFSYILPLDIPSSMEISTKFKYCKVKCFIKYYIRIKFQRPGLFSFNKHFRTEIKVMSEVVAKLPRQPFMYEGRKQLIHLFSRNKSFIIVTVTIVKSAIQVGGKFEVHYEVANKSHVVIRNVKIKLVQVYIFKAKGHRKVRYEENLPGTKFETPSINCRDIQNMSVGFDVPSQIYSVDNAMIVSRDYFIRIIVELPMPHRNAVVDIPVQIGVHHETIDQNRPEQSTEEVNYDDPPPSYWGAMGQINDNEGASDDEPLIS